MSSDGERSRQSAMPGGGSAERARAVDDLLRRVAHGDEPAFSALYELVAQRVYGLALRVLRSPAHAEEVAQEVLVEVWRTAGRHNPARGSATAWIFTIAHRRAVDRVRSEQAGADRARRVGVASAEIPYDDVVERATTRLDCQRVRRCMEGLTESQREAITLAYYEGLTYREVAELLDTALPTVKTRMREGLSRLRHCLGVIGG
ncbi:MAG TPA: ECF RNA polymerase sigma factor SigK [Pilimelia sp.]|nr:ECF RNA polymerase sigma factor SigK [Pilimelia sp.]